MLLIANDLKTFRIVKSLDDAALLQSDLNALVKWCDRNALSLNVQKCKFMSFNRSHSNIYFGYNINNIPLEKVFNCKDLGVFFDSKLTYSTHINYIKNKSLKLFGFIKFSCSNFNNLNALRLIYCSCIRSTLEYCSIIRSHYLQKINLTLDPI